MRNTLMCAAVLLAAFPVVAAPLQEGQRMGSGPDAQSYVLAKKLAEETSSQAEAIRMHAYENTFTKAELKQLLDFYESMSGHKTNFSGTLIGCDYDNEGGCAEYQMHDADKYDEQKIAKDFFATPTGQKWKKLHNQPILNEDK